MAEVCVVCAAMGSEGFGGDIAPKKLGRKTVPLCARHAALSAGHRSVESLVVAMIGERRATDRRRTFTDRRAFWRPSPDRRRESTEAGRRARERGATG